MFSEIAPALHDVDGDVLIIHLRNLKFMLCCVRRSMCLYAIVKQPARLSCTMSESASKERVADLCPALDVSCLMRDKNWLRIRSWRRVAGTGDEFCC